MKNFNDKEIKTLFSNLCCSKCRNDFNSDSITVKKQEGDLYRCNLSCTACGMDFGDILFRFKHKSNIHTPLEIIDGPPPINTDDVINAHRFIKKM